MNDRERFEATMHYQPRDRSPITDFNFWDETLPVWHKQGLPRHVNRANSAEFFGTDYSLGSGASSPMDVGVEMMLCPSFAEIVIEDRGDREVVQQDDGVRVLRNKVEASIPMHVGHLRNAVLGDTVEYLIDNMVLNIYAFENEAIDIELPTNVDLKVVDAPMALAGDTATGATKQVTVESGLKVSVPLFVDEGDTIRVDTRDGSYVTRV